MNIDAKLVSDQQAWAKAGFPRRAATPAKGDNGVTVSPKRGKSWNPCQQSASGAIGNTPKTFTPYKSVTNVTLGIDPGSTQSAYVLLEGGGITDFGKVDNAVLLELVGDVSVCTGAACYCEEIRCYGMRVGKAVLDTARFTGRIEDRWSVRGIEDDFHLVGRKEIVKAFTGTMTAGDKEIRAAMIRRWGEPGTRVLPGVTYGISADVWSALAIATYGQFVRTED